MKLVKGLSVGLFAMFALVLGTGCSKDEVAQPAAPTIEITELGSNNSKTMVPGFDLHLEGNVVAQGTIRDIRVQITPVNSGPGWTFTRTYTTGYAGTKNAELHEHIDVPADARLGLYEVLVSVTDNAGRKAETKGELTIMRDATLPSATNLSAALNSSAQLRVAGTINAPSKIAKVTVQVQSSAWTRSFDFTEAAMVGQTSYAFQQNIDMAAAPNGHYHINVTILDQAGKQVVYSFHLDK